MIESYLILSEVMMTIVGLRYYRLKSGKHCGMQQSGTIFFVKAKVRLLITFTRDIYAKKAIIT